jgi:hypothetical protein
MLKTAKNLQLGDFIFNIISRDMKTDSKIGNIVGVNPKYYIYETTEVVSLRLDKEDKDFIWVNDSIKLPRDPDSPSKRTALDSYFTDENEVLELCSSLSNTELNRITEIQDELQKANAFLISQISTKSFK